MKRWIRITISAVLAIIAGLIFSAVFTNMRYGKPQPLVSEAGLPQLVQFSRADCESCTDMKPVIEDMQRVYEGRLEVRLFDVSEETSKSLTYFHRVRVVPAQLFLDKSGVVLWRHDGPLSKKEILEKWAELGYDFSAQ